MESETEKLRSGLFKITLCGVGRKRAQYPNRNKSNNGKRKAALVSHCENLAQECNDKEELAFITTNEVA